MKPTENPHPSSLEAQSTPIHDLPFPEGGLQAWLVVLGSLCIISSSFGLQTAIGCLNSYWETHQLSSYSTSEIGWISAVNIFLTLILGVQIGPLFDRYGPRWLLISGSVAYVGSLVAMAQCQRYWEFMLTFGLVAGMATAVLVTTGVAVIAHWFEEKMGQANGVVFLGSSAGEW
jgi:MFS family permease